MLAARKGLVSFFKPLFSVALLILDGIKAISPGAFGAGKY